ncbi:hypothetical protein DAPPUDRAFT_328254 [Daphnia pulex]|uniref:Uncharacterized protein n=1 Tax=Daphnia pulex TaxID=6669 RepID=E9HDF1_DAPPU|nr:hypothetical protein DAPPUDRAFT_328254 [Daphnia pulex]|eukprot:EFX70259.1 hypothetical protein DAPPUDRAFT_328254 [Daphnia pulex]
MIASRSCKGYAAQLFPAVDLFAVLSFLSSSKDELMLRNAKNELIRPSSWGLRLSHVVQPVLDSKIHKEKWEKETNFFQLRNEYGVELSVTIKQIKFKVTAVERHKSQAKNAAYMTMYKKIFNARKVDAFKFMKTIPSTSPNRIINCVVNGNLSITVNNHQVLADDPNGVVFTSSDVRYKNRTLEGYVVNFQGNQPQISYFNGRSDQGSSAVPVVPLLSDAPASMSPTVETAQVEVEPAGLIVTPDVSVSIAAPMAS